MSVINYNKLFNLKVTHTFFSNNRCNCFEYSPAENSRILTQRYGFKFTISDEGFSFYSNKETSVENLLNYLKKVTIEHYFDFNAKVTNSDFFNYTDLPLDWSGTLMYDSKFKDNTTKANNLALVPKFSTSSKSMFFINLKIDFDTIIKLSNLGNEAPTFYIKFKSRDSIWEYYIIDRTSITGEETTILGESDIQFIKQLDVKLLNGETAIKLASNRGIAFSQSPNYKFNLANLNKKTNDLNVRSKVETIVSGLPNPSLSHIDIIDFKGKKMVSSPMYIYV